MLNADSEMSRLRQPPTGFIIYLMLSIVINLFILILRISAHELQTNNTLKTITYSLDTTALISSVNRITEDNSEMGK